MMYQEWGPIGGLVGTWRSDWTGVDVSYHNDKGKIAETTYRETTTFAPFGPIDTGEQRLYGLDYRTEAFCRDRDEPFHFEVGYWMWDSTNEQVMRCFIVPQGSTLIAGANVAPDATTFQLASVLGSNTYGILSNPYLNDVAKTTRYDVTISITHDTFSYDETTVVEHVKHPIIIMHADRNTLHRVTEAT